MTEPTVRPGANAESSPLNLRAPHEVIARLTRVASKLPPGLFTRHKLAVIALEHGLAVIERDPSILLRGPAEAPVEPPSSPEVPAVAVAPAALAPVARVERVERASRVVPAVASAPAVDPRQLSLTAAASNAPVSGATLAHAALHERFTDVRDRFHVTFADATHALAAVGLPVKNLHREMVKPTAKWTPAHADALTAWLDTCAAQGWYPTSEPAAARVAPVSESTPSPSEPSADVDALTQANEALRVRYRAGLAAKLVTPGDVWIPLGDKSESRLRMWAKGVSKNVSAERLATIASLLDAKGVPA